MNGWMDGLVDGWINVLMNGCIGGWMCVLIGGLMDGWIGEWMDGIFSFKTYHRNRYLYMYCLKHFKSHSITTDRHFPSNWPR